MAKGSLITFEGLEGSGKTTAVRRLVEWLNEIQIPTISSKEPGTVWDGLIRKLILEGKDKPTPIAELFLFLADRAQHVDRVVVPALKQGNWVVLDRYCDSTVVYQSFIRDVLPADQIMKLNWIAALHAATPDLTIVLDLDVEEANSRVAGRAPSEIRIGEATGTQQWIRAGFKDIAAQNTRRMVVVDASGTEEEVFERIREVVLTRLLR